MGLLIKREHLKKKEIEISFPQAAEQPLSVNEYVAMIQVSTVMNYSHTLSEEWPWNESSSLSSIQNCCCNVPTKEVIPHQ